VVRKKRPKVTLKLHWLPRLLTFKLKQFYKYSSRVFNKYKHKIYANHEKQQIIKSNSYNSKMWLSPIHFTCETWRKCLGCFSKHLTTICFFITFFFVWRYCCFFNSPIYNDISDFLWQSIWTTLLLLIDWLHANV
jgi:hypothetical protein